MSNLEPEPQLHGGQAVTVAATPSSVLLPGHDVPIGRYTLVRRLLPQRERRMVGAWCFADHFGPDDLADRPGMDVPPHPHTGLQTVSWLLDGEILHRDSLGNVQTIVPGQLNLMTAGQGIAHAEQSPAQRPPVLHGLQLWIALPERECRRPARFEHHPVLPALRIGDAEVTVVAGELAGVASPARVHSPLVGAELVLAGEASVPVERDFEYAALLTGGGASVAGVSVAGVSVAGVELAPGALLYLGRGRDQLALRGNGRLFLLGGEPFTESLVMWWNFVGRSHEEIVAAREDWAAERRFGTVTGYPGERLPAPAMPTTRLKARGADGHTND